MGAAERLQGARDEPVERATETPASRATVTAIGTGRSATAAPTSAAEAADEDLAGPADVEQAALEAEADREAGQDQRRRCGEGVGQARAARSGSIEIASAMPPSVTFRNDRPVAPSMRLS